MPISPLRVSTVEPIGTDATPFSGRKPLSWNAEIMPRKPSRRPAGRQLHEHLAGDLADDRVHARDRRDVAGRQRLARVADAVGVTVRLVAVRHRPGSCRTRAGPAVAVAVGRPPR